MTEFHGGILCIVAAGEGAHLAVVTDDDADVGVVGHNMHGLIEQIGTMLSSPPRAAATGNEAGV
jgi:predicted regulator of Ras-like GTPase activity (Roadblock/LC7/MglB family)